MNNNVEEIKNSDIDWESFFNAIKEEKKILETFRITRELPQKYNIENPDKETEAMIQIWYAMIDNKTLDAEIKTLTKGGFFVDILGIEGFMPTTQAYIPIQERNYLGVILPVNILKLSIEKNNAVVGRQSLIETDYYSVEDIKEDIINEYNDDIKHNWYTFDEDDIKTHKNNVKAYLKSIETEDIAELDNLATAMIQICKLYITNKEVIVKVLSTTKDGFIVDLNGINAFLPMVEAYIPKTEKNYIGLLLSVQISRIFLDDNCVIVSRKEIIEKNYYPLEDFFQKVHGRPIRSKYIGDSEDNIMNALSGGYGDVFGF